MHQKNEWHYEKAWQSSASAATISTFLKFSWKFRAVWRHFLQFLNHFIPSREEEDVPAENSRDQII